MRTYINDLSRLVDGPTTLAQAQINAAVIQAAIATNVVLHLRPGSRISVAGQLSFAGTSHAGIVWDGRGARPYLHMPRAWFNSTRLSIGRNTANTGRSLLIVIDGGPATRCRDIRLEGIGIVSDTQGGRYIAAVCAFGVRDFRMLGCAITGIPNGFGLTAGSLTGDSQICANAIHDFYDNSTVMVDGRAWPGLVQSTAIELDNNRYAGSVGVLIAENRIERIMKGPDFAALPVNGGAPGKPLGMQTDGISIGHYSCDGTRILDNFIDTVDEGIDLFGSNSTVRGNHIHNAHAHGLKLIHGAQNNRVSDTVIQNAGRIGIVMAGATGSNERSVSGNIVTGGTVSGVGYNDVWTGNSVVAAIRFECGRPGPQTYYPTGNRVSGTTINLTRKCAFGWFGDTTNADLRNMGTDIRMTGTPGVARIRITPSPTGRYNGAVALAGATKFVTTL